MRVVTTIGDVRSVVRAARASGRRIGFVPTMGFLHDGHLALVDEARRRADFVVMSIFVNPLQFGPGEDLSRYPRDPDGDATKARGRHVDVLFTPGHAEIYAVDRRVEVVPRKLHERWEGAVRPGHFAGVLTVVAKLFNIVQPDVAVFGQKDVQQATLIRALVRDLDFPIDLVVAPTTREASGLAMSSRNSYLSEDERQRATTLSRALFAVRDAYRSGERDVARLAERGERILRGESAVQVDYFALANGDSLDPAAIADDSTIAMVAARVGRTRLIDNVILGSA